jgi:spermidine/putrescine ABC transporter ATP-binding subunit
MVKNETYLRKDRPSSGTTDGAPVELKNISKRFGDVVAVDSVSLQLEVGEFLTLLGPSGSGKTTTLMMIAGFETVDKGEILINGEPVTHIPPYARNLGFVFQHYALFPHMTVFENIAFPLKVRRIDPQTQATRIKEVLELVMLPGLENRMPSQLSGGQQQRVALARALIFNPLVLLMDEPLSALDKKLRQQMQLEIKHIQHNLNITVIYVTHDQEEALIMSDRIAVMNKGKIAQVASPEGIYEKPSDSFVADFIGETNFFSGTVCRSERGSSVMKTNDDIRLPLSSSVDLQNGQPVRIAIRPEKLLIRSTEKQLRHDKRPDKVSVSGTIQEVIYLGDICKYLIQIGNHRVICKELISAGHERLLPGQSVDLDWRNEDVQMLLV